MASRRACQSFRMRSARAVPAQRNAHAWYSVVQKIRWTQESDGFLWLIITYHHFPQQNFHQLGVRLCRQLHLGGAQKPPTILAQHFSRRHGLPSRVSRRFPEPHYWQEIHVQRFFIIILHHSLHHSQFFCIILSILLHRHSQIPRNFQFSKGVRLQRPGARIDRSQHLRLAADPTWHPPGLHQSLLWFVEQWDDLPWKWLLYHTVSMYIYIYIDLDSRST